MVHQIREIGVGVEIDSGLNSGSSEGFERSRGRALIRLRARKQGYSQRFLNFRTYRSIISQCRLFGPFEQRVVNGQSCPHAS